MRVAVKETGEGDFFGFELGARVATVVGASTDCTEDVPGCIGTQATISKDMKKVKGVLIFIASLEIICVANRFIHRERASIQPLFLKPNN
jgi:hypothetical protein